MTKKKADRVSHREWFFHCFNKKIWLLACFVLFFNTNVLAQNTSEEEFTLEDTVVTATKTGEVNLQDVPVSITSLSEEYLDNVHSYLLADIGKYIPNVQLRGRGGTIGVIRGVSPDLTGMGFDQSMSFYTDGVLIQRGAGVAAQLYDVERVEVLRGPQGTLYGRNTTGGAINLISKKPSDQLEIDISAGIGNYSERRIDAAISGPLVKDKMKLRITFSDGEHDGYMHNLTGEDIDDADFSAIRAILEITPSDEIDILLIGDYYTSQFNGFANRLINSTGLPQALALAAGYPESMWNSDDFWTTAQNYDTNRSIRNAGFSAHITAELTPDMFLRSITAHRKSDNDWSEDADGTPVDMFHANGNGQGSTTFTQELQLDGTWDRLKWLVGLYYLYDREESNPTHFYHFTMYGRIVRRSTMFENVSYAGFGNLTYEITDKLSVEAGLRYTEETKKTLLAETVDYWPLPGAEIPVTSLPPREHYDLWYEEMPQGVGLTDRQNPAQRSWDSWTPKIGITYKLNDDVLLYGSFSKGYKSGAWSFFNAPDDKYLEPEELDAYEIGIKSDWFGDRLRINVAAFTYDYANLQVRTMRFVGGAAATHTENAEGSSIDGAELEILARPIPEITLNAAASVLDAVYDSYLAIDPRGNIVDVGGNQVTYAPDWKWTLGGQYVVPVGDHGYLTLRADISMTAEQFFTPFNETMLAQDTFTIVDAVARFETADGHWNFEVYGKNLGEEEYFMAGLNFIGGAIRGDEIGFPRTYGAKVTYRY